MQEVSIHSDDVGKPQGNTLKHISGSQIGISSFSGFLSYPLMRSTRCVRCPLGQSRYLALRSFPHVFNVIPISLDPSLRKNVTSSFYPNINADASHPLVSHFRIDTNRSKALWGYSMHMTILIAHQLPQSPSYGGPKG